TEDIETLNIKEDDLTVILVVGVNGVGKTTSIGKLAYSLKQEGKNVMLAAGDTFRAGAIEQLEVWGARADVDVIKQKEGSDPAAVIFDAIQAARSRDVDVLICDTAGRLQNKVNLMNELEKVQRIIKREIPTAPHEVLLVLAVLHELNIPVKFVGLGEQIEDLQPFDAHAFVYGLFADLMTDA